MKKLLLILLAVGVMGACKKSGVSDNGINTGMLVGTWKPQTETTYTYSNGSISSTDVTGFDSTDRLILNSGGTGSIISSGHTTTLKYTITGKNISFFFTGESGSSMSTGEIKTLTSTKLEIYRANTSADGQAFNVVYLK